MGEDIQKAKAAILDEIKSLEHVDKTDTTEVLFTNVKQGVFNLQVKFWLEQGNNFGNLKSDAIMRINERLMKEGVNLVTPTSINLTTADSSNSSKD